MLRVRDAQLKVFEQVSLDRFVADLGKALLTEFPRRAAVLGTDGVEAWVRHGVERAATYGITSVEATGRYIRLMFVFGRDFDVHPDLPWARACLTDSSASQDGKINELTLASRDYLADLLAARQG